MNTVIIHPMLVHFPIALLIVGAMFTVISVIIKNAKVAQCTKIFACWTMILGAVSALVAVMSGYVFTTEMVGLMGRLRNAHMMYALVTTALGVLTAILIGISVYGNFDSKHYYHYTACVLSVVTAILVGVTGHYGGMMVFGI